MGCGEVVNTLHVVVGTRTARVFHATRDIVGAWSEFETVPRDAAYFTAVAVVGV